MPRSVTSIGLFKKGGFFLFWLVGVVVFLLDQVSKYLIRENLPVGSVKPVVKGFFNLVHVENPGIAFSVLANNSSPFTRIFIILVALTAVIVLNLMIVRSRNSHGLTLATYGLILGGALGNLYDRTLRGTVTDFLDFYINGYHWPAFNIADSAITLGAFLLLLGTLRPHRP